MTDLSKGILEIDGFEIGKDTKPLEIKEQLKNRYSYHIDTPNVKSESFIFNNVCIDCRCFSIELYFYSDVLESIRLDYMNEECYSFVQLYEQDLLWLKSVLGEPSESGAFECVYRYRNHEIVLTYQQNDGRCGADESIEVIYE